MGVFPFETLSAQGNLSDSLRQELRSVRTHAKKAEIHIGLSRDAMSRDYKESLAHAQEAVYAAQKDGGHSLQMRAYKSLASVEFYTGLFDQAILHFDRTAEEAEKSGEAIEAINNRLNSALIHSTLGEYRTCIRTMEALRPNLMREYRKAGKEWPLSEQVSMHLNLGVSYLGIGELTRANQYLDSAIGLMGQGPDPSGTLFKLLVTKGKLKVQEGKMDEAIRLLEQAEARLVDLNGDKTRRILVQNAWVDVYEKQGDAANAMRIAKEGMRMAHAAGSLQMEKAFAEGISRIYRRQGPSDSAMRYMDMVASFEKDMQTGRVKEEMMRKELRVEFQKKERELAERERIGRSRLAFEVLGISVLAMAFIFGVVYYRRRFRRMNLQRLQQEVEARHSALERQRLEAELGRKDSELERIGYELKKYSLIEGLVGNLQSESTSADPGPRLSSSQHRTKAWEEFEYRFQQIHSGFYERLKQAHPDLTLNERRLCAFLKLDMTTKEISDITGQSIRAVNMGRFRLRQKLHLTNTDQAIFDYLGGL